MADKNLGTISVGLELDLQGIKSQVEQAKRELGTLENIGKGKRTLTFEVKTPTVHQYENIIKNINTRIGKAERTVKLEPEFVVTAPKVNKLIQAVSREMKANKAGVEVPVHAALARGSVTDFRKALKTAMSDRGKVLVPIGLDHHSIPAFKKDIQESVGTVIVKVRGDFEGCETPPPGGMGGGGGRAPRPSGGGGTGGSGGAARPSPRGPGTAAGVAAGAAAAGA